ncbi:response regulator transcription factor [Flavobacterium sp. CYK-4]|uniref:LytR/AlgR family response regulator transcription factor n=1 Tax=Flavobacterium lotistagni TaxID=2709660 RepID=UPI00140E53E4|nr:LytTR family DNA-binding domain-containing protein [Flavobacterium lotistagni]NHM07282.1 response regulator transcription factor [Flavobacterium lotistagni]
MKLNCLIIEDERIAREGLKGYIDRIDSLILIGSFSNPLLALKVLKTEQIDLIFLDIRMPEISGITFLKTLSHPPAVIITTAYAHHAVEGFELNVTDYLLKPFSFERFLTAVQKVSSKTAPGNETALQLKDDFLFLRCENKIEKIFYNDILFVQAMENYVIIQTADRKYISYLTLKSVENQLPADQFVKVHKSYLVPIAKINTIEGNTIRINQYQVNFSRNNKEEILGLILKDKLLKR